MRATAVLVLAMWAAASSSFAQVVTEGPPKSIILPNYDLVRIGQFEALESGAVIAQVAGPLANVYNAAGLAASDKSAVNASSTGYQSTNLGLEGLGQKVSAGKIANLGGFLGLVLADPVVKSQKWRLGFSVYTPLDWEPGTLSGQGAGQVGDTERQIDYRTQVSLRATVPSLGAGFRVSPKLRFGAAVQVPIIDVLQQQQVSSLILATDEAAQVSRVVAADGSTWTLRGTVGMQWDVTSALALGVNVTTPTARLWGSSLYQENTTTASGGGVDALTFRDPDARLEYRLPLSVSGGVALRLGKVRLEADVRWYDAIDAWDMFTSDSVGLAVSQVGGAPVVTSPVVLSPVTLAYRSVLNFAIGGRIPLSSRLQLHAGFNSDASPLATTDESFRKVNIIGATIGLSLTGEKLSGSLGAGFQHGTSPDTEVGIPPLTRETKLSVDTFQLLYSLSYSF
jgi:hypothetical protein